MTRAQAVTAGPRLRVDPIACDGRGLCAEVLPELIRIDDWGFPIIADGHVPVRLRPAAGEAVRICPKLALRLDPGPERDRSGAGRARALWRQPAPAHQGGRPGNMAVPPHGGRRPAPARQVPVQEVDGHPGHDGLGRTLAFVGRKVPRPESATR
jgi:ferredoxin